MKYALIKCETRKKVKEMAPWANKIIKVKKPAYWVFDPAPFFLKRIPEEDGYFVAFKLEHDYTECHCGGKVLHKLEMWSHQKYFGITRWECKKCGASFDIEFLKRNEAKGD